MFRVPRIPFQNPRIQLPFRLNTLASVVFSGNGSSSTPAEAVTGLNFPSNNTSNSAMRIVFSGSNKPDRTSKTLVNTNSDVIHSLVMVLLIVVLVLLLMVLLLVVRFTISSKHLRVKILLLLRVDRLIWLLKVRYIYRVIPTKLLIY
jgi:hypothetical protein